MTDTQDPQIITDSAALDELCSQLAAAGQFAFDTEFVGEDYYQPEICLVQVSTDSFCALIDPFADLDLAPFWSLVADERIRKIVHAGAEDLAIAWKRSGKVPANVFDLQIAAGIVGLGYPLSLASLARQTIGQKIHKSQTLTNWRQRPLTRDQIGYAAEDVAYLPRMHRLLLERTRLLGRESWVMEECATLCDPANLVPSDRRKVLRLRGISSLSRQELAIAEALLNERDELAQQYNRPPRTVLKDHLLVEMARHGWTDVGRLRSLRGLNLSNAALRRLVDVINRAKQSPPGAWPEASSDSITAEEEVLTSLVAAVLRDFCNREQLSYALLTNKQYLTQLVRSRTRPASASQPSPLTSGWRRIAVGQLLDDLLSGRRGLRVRQEGTSFGLAVE